LYLHRLDYGSPPLVIINGRGLHKMLTNMCWKEMADCIFYNRVLPRIDPTLNVDEILADNNDGVPKRQTYLSFKAEIYRT
jgi:hypothetical protein